MALEDVGNVHQCPLALPVDHHIGDSGLERPAPVVVRGRIRSAEHDGHRWVALLDALGQLQAGGEARQVDGEADDRGRELEYLVGPVVQRQRLIVERRALVEPDPIPAAVVERPLIVGVGTPRVRAAIGCATVVALARSMGVVELDVQVEALGLVAVLIRIGLEGSWAKWRQGAPCRALDERNTHLTPAFRSIRRAGAQGRQSRPDSPAGGRVRATAALGAVHKAGDFRAR